MTDRLFVHRIASRAVRRSDQLDLLYEDARLAVNVVIAIEFEAVLFGVCFFVGAIAMASVMVDDVECICMDALRDIWAAKSATVARQVAMVQSHRIDIVWALRTIDIDALRAGAPITIEVLLPVLFGLG
jgi:hypothetical protein